MKAYISIAVISTLILTSCLKNNEPGTNDPADAGGTASVLEGTWKSDCKTDVSNSEKHTFKFTGQTLALNFESFSDTACATPRLSISFSLSFVIGGAVSNPAGATALDLSYPPPLLQTTVTASSADVATDLNASTECGFSDWAAGVPKTVTNSIQCDYVPGFPSPFYQIFKIDGNNLYVGKDSAATGDGSTPEKRATVLDTVILIKQ